MNIMNMKRSLLILLFCIIGLSTVSAATWSYTGHFSAGDTILINSNITIVIDYDASKKAYFAIFSCGEKREVILINGTTKAVNFADIDISLVEFNNLTVLSIRSESPLTVQVNNITADLLKELETLRQYVVKLEKENSKLKEQVNNLNEKVNILKKSQTQSSNQDFNNLQLKILNLTRENRKLKEELMNLTKRYNALKGENNYLKSQLETYKAVFSGLIQQVEQQAEKNYIEEAKDSEKDAKRLWWALAISIGLVGGVGVLMYRKKRKYELE